MEEEQVWGRQDLLGLQFSRTSGETIRDGEALESELRGGMGKGGGGHKQIGWGQRQANILSPVILFQV